MIKKHASKFFMLFLALALVLSLFSIAITQSARAAYGARITVSGSQFLAGGARIWINGANTPWNNWDDFGGNFNSSWWDTHFQTLRANGINATRIWILMDGEVGVTIDSSGHVSGATAAHWANLDTLFSLAASRQIYVQPTLLSFDVTKTSHTNYMPWRNMFNSDANIDSFVTNYVTPFAVRYKDNPWIWSIDLINEPDWIVENQECGQLPWARIQQLAAKSAKAVHANSPILFSVGMAMPKYQTATISGDMMSNSALQAFLNDPQVYLDFRITHYYDWMSGNWGNTFYKTPADHGFDTSKPWVIGENPANGTSGHTTTQDYESAYAMGWQGAMAWTSNGVDSNGSITQLGPATTAFWNNHASLVFPGGTSNTPTRTNTPTTGVTLTPTRTNTAGPTSTRTPTATSGPSLTPTRTSTIGLTPTKTVTSFVGSMTPTRTLTPGTPTAGCSPVTSTITAPFTYDGAGAFCWQSSNLGTYINSWNLTSLTVNGVNETNLYVASGSYPAKINGYWYVSYNSTVAWGHFEAK
jgi:hypothetical protein